MLVHARRAAAVCLFTMTALATLPAAQAPATDARAPERFRVRLDTTRGAIAVDCTRAWAPLGVDRFYTLVTSGYYDDSAFFRVVTGSGRSSASVAHRPRRRPGAAERWVTIRSWGSPT